MPLNKAEDIRNIAIVGHGGAGKTTLAEAMLFTAKVIDRMGSVENGTTASDFEEEERERKISIDTSILHLAWKGRGINVLDTPGYPEFVGQVLSALRAVDAVVLVVSGPAGVELNTRKCWQYAQEEGLAKFIVLSKTDEENVDFESLLKNMRDVFGQGLVPFNLPLGKGAGLEQTLDVFAPPEGLEAKMQKGLERAREQIIEAAVEADDQLLERYLEGQEPSGEELTQTLAERIAQGKVAPVLCTSAIKGLGVAQLLDALARFAPSPTASSRELFLLKAEEKEPLESSNSRFSAQVFKTMTDPYVGKLSFLRVFSGKGTGDTMLYNPRTNRSVKAGQLLRIKGKEQSPLSEVLAGDIVAVAKIEDLAVSDTLHDKREAGAFKPIHFPQPMVSLAVEPKSRGDEQRLSTSLSKLSGEDPTFVVTRERQTNELVITGMSTLHLEIMLGRLKKRFDVEVVARPPKIPYKETITTATQAQYRHKKQTGGRGQYGEVYLKLEPLERGTGFEFVDKIVGGAIPNQYIPAVEKGIREVLDKGVIAGYPVTDIRVTLYDGTFHTVDSSEIAFKIAANRAFQEGFRQARPCLLEPIVLLEVTVPNEFMGDITSDLNGRRGRILGMDSLGDLQVVKALVPVGEISRYATELRSRTGGQGFYTVEFSHYDVVPQRIQEELVARAKAKED